MISMQLFFSYFSIRIRFIARKYRGLSYTVDRLIYVVESRFSYSPLLYHEYRHVSEFRGYSTKLLSRKNSVFKL